ncbi:MAG: phosphate signaling complex protein PhoU [bacterium]|nr:phosphate signaling complex protein PhoU [bacterium]
MSKHLHTDLQSLERNLLALGARVEEAVRLSIAALSQKRVDIAEEVIAGDREIDLTEVALEEECLKVLALHQPVAGDLRFVTACMKITNDLERIGDLSVNISRRVRALSKWDPLPVPSLLSEMAEGSTAMVQSAIEAFVNENGEKAREVMRDDDHIDAMHKRCLRDLMDQMKASPESINTLMLYSAVSRHLERIADHATNIAEDVVYMADGDIVRHQREI